MTLLAELVLIAIGSGRRLRVDAAGVGHLVDYESKLRDKYDRDHGHGRRKLLPPVGPLSRELVAELVHPMGGGTLLHLCQNETIENRAGLNEFRGPDDPDCKYYSMRQ